MLPAQVLASAALLLRPSRAARPHVSLVLTVISLSAFMAGSSPNVALGKATSLSNPWGSINPASRAVDSITTCDTPNIGDMFAISNGGWWMVDLGAPYVVQQVTVFGRGLSWSSQSANLGLHIGSSSANGGQSNAQCGGTFSAPPESISACPLLPNV
jgi:hypothetical protein